MGVAAGDRRVLIVGGGGREHALAWAIAKSPRVAAVAVAPGNGGTASIAENIPVADTDVAGLVQAAKDWRADLVVIGPESSLAAGAADALRDAGFSVFGSSRAATEIESNKRFAKEILDHTGVPTGKWRAFTSFEPAVDYVREIGAPIVVKAAGLAAGKGVVVAQSVDEAIAALDDIICKRSFGQAGDEVVVEQFLNGREVSLMALIDGRTVLPLQPACDYKRIRDNDEGPNTGGMGAYTDPPWFGAGEVRLATKNILQPVADALAERGTPLQGVLYAGLMVDSDGPKVLEFNARFGDPETQVVLPSMNGDLLDLLEAVASGTLASVQAPTVDRTSVSVVLASGGYPRDLQHLGSRISGLENVPPEAMVFHAGTRLQDGMVVTSGGRVLNVVGTGKDIAEAREAAYEAAKYIFFEGMQYRSDIGLREVKS